MSIDSESDLLGLRRAGRVVRRALDAMKAAVRPGVTTAELDDVAAGVLRRHGARSAPALFYGFPGWTCISVNDEVVHGVPGARALRDGDLVTLDVTVELDGYVADAAVTVPVGRGTELGERLCACAEAAFWKGFRAARAGARLAAVGAAVEREVTRHGFKVLGELQGHGVGRHIHEEPSVPNFFDPRATERLTEGLVIALEPLIAVGSAWTRDHDDGWTVSSDDGSLTAHFENTIVIMREGDPLVLTA